MSNESNFVIKNVDVKCFYDDIVNCIYFNKISKFVFITRNLHIYHMSINNTITHYNKNKCIRKPHDDNYSKYNANLKLNADITKWLTVGMNLRYIKEKTITPSYYFIHMIQL